MTPHAAHAFVQWPRIGAVPAIEPLAYLAPCVNEAVDGHGVHPSVESSYTSLPPCAAWNPLAVSVLAESASGAVIGMPSRSAPREVATPPLRSVHEGRGRTGHP